MRDEFYADRRDLWKWTVALNEAAGRTIVYVAMYRQNRQRPVPSGVRPDVYKFFARERQELTREMKCARISGLTLRIVPLLDAYDPKKADVYFDRVCGHIASRSNGHGVLVFVDPDTGIAESKPTARHVSFKHLALVWASMSAGDELVVYQHNLREKPEDWIERKRGGLAKTLGMRESAVRSQPHADVCFFCMSK